MLLIFVEREFKRKKPFPDNQKKKERTMIKSIDKSRIHSTELAVKTTIF